MRTQDLIAALSADAQRSGPPLSRRIGSALALGAFISLVVFVVAIGPRPDVMTAMHTMRFDLKFLDTIALLAPAFFLCLRLSRPEVEPGLVLAWLLAPIALLLVGVAIELATVPSAQWGARIMGPNWLHCLTLIPLFSVPPLAALILALRDGAPQRPALTGALAGAAAAGAAATIYASNCTDDSPLFVMTWYPIATGIVAAAGAWAGHRWLRW